MVAQPEPVELAGDTVDRDPAAGAAMLLVMPARESCSGSTGSARSRTPPNIGPTPRIARLTSTGTKGLLWEGRPRVAHRERLGQPAGAALVLDAQALERLLDLEAHPPRLEARVVRDRGPLES